MSGGVVSGREDLVDGILAARWPDGSLDGFPGRRVAEMIADALLASPALADLLATERQRGRDEVRAAVERLCVEAEQNGSVIFGGGRTPSPIHPIQVRAALADVPAAADRERGAL